MRPVTYDFDVVTDAPAPGRRKPETAEQAPEPDPEEQRRRTAPPDQDDRGKVWAAE
jgi:hypothetical protein